MLKDPDPVGACLTNALTWMHLFSYPFGIPESWSSKYTWFVIWLVRNLWCFSFRFFLLFWIFTSNAMVPWYFHWKDQNQLLNTIYIKSHSFSIYFVRINFPIKMISEKLNWSLVENSAVLSFTCIRTSASCLWTLTCELLLNPKILTVSSLCPVWGVFRGKGNWRMFLLVIFFIFVWIEGK